MIPSYHRESVLLNERPKSYPSVGSLAKVSSALHGEEEQSLTYLWDLVIFDHEGGTLNLKVSIL